MGLDDELQYLRQKERSRIRRMRCVTPDLWDSYPDSFGRIKCRKAFLAAQKKKRSWNWPKELYFKASKSKSPVFPAAALDRFKGLVYLLYRLREAQGNQEYISRLRQEFSDNKIRNIKFSSEDLALYLPIIDLYSTTKIREKFAKHVVPKGLASFVDGRYDEFIRQTSPEWYTYAATYVEELMTHTMRYAPRKLNPLLDAVEVLSGLDHLCRELWSELLDMEKKDISAFAPIDGLKVELNISDRRVLENHIDCCITGPKGDARDASVLYMIDPSIDVWYFSPSGIMGDTLPFGMAILVKAKGWHVSDKKKKDYLVFEGFPANQKYCARMGNFKHRERPYYGDYTEREFSLSQVGYMLGLHRAHSLGIPNLFINVKHGLGTQPSVGYAIREAASSANIPQGFWEFDRHPRKFSLLKDPYTNGGDFEYIDCSNKRLEYTHLLQKPRLPSKLISKKRNDPHWHGEGFFDTWYDWNEFVMETYPGWSDKLKAEHPYAEAVWRRGKDPQWNLGIGYCKGFEVDVAKECERLGIS